MTWLRSRPWRCDSNALVMTGLHAGRPVRCTQHRWHKGWHHNATATWLTGKAAIEVSP